jgi:RecA/RadA recombinase
MAGIKDPFADLDPRFKVLNDFCTAVDKRFGRGSIGTASGALDIPRISTGSMSLDHALGGGVPARRLSLFYGKKSTGKSSTAMMVVAHAQGLCRHCFRPVKDLVVKSVKVDRDGDEREIFYAEGTCDCYAKGIWNPPRLKFYDEKKGVYLDEPEREYKARLKRLKENSYGELICGLQDIEGTHDKEWAASLGVDNRRLIYYRPETAEECIDVYDPWVRTGTIDLLVLDTVAFLTPSEEIEKSSVDWQRGLQARLMSKFSRKMNAALTHCSRQFGQQPTQIWCNQVRMSIGPFGGEVVPGGLSQGFAASVEVKFFPNKPEVLKLNTGKKGDEIVVPVSTDIKFKCVKNKVASVGVEGYYRLILTDTETLKKGQISEYDQVWRWARYYELVGKADNGKWFYWGLNGKIEAKTFSEIQSTVSSSQEEIAWLRDRLMDMLLGRKRDDSE